MKAQPLTANHLSQAINHYVEELATLTDQARLSAAMQAYLDTCARFHRYSWRNTLLILFAKPDATQVAGYQKWQQLKRHVRKGQRGIPILAPMVIHVDEKDPDRQLVLRFKVVYVFDFSQTEGEPLPPEPDWNNPEQQVRLTERLIAYAASLGITVTVERLAGTTQGLSKGGAIVLRPESGTATLIHELAHELMHRCAAERPASRSERETEAEAVAYVVGRHFGLESANSPNYLVLWHADSTLIGAHLQRISAGSQQIITAVEGNCSAEAEASQ